MVSDSAATLSAQPGTSGKETVARIRTRKRQSRSQLVTFLLMGALGVLSFGTAMAAFLRASVSPNSESLTIGVVLVIIALVCVGVSGYNLYQRWGRGDRV